MAFRIEFEPGARRSLDTIHSTERDRILRFLRDQIAPADNPRTLGDALQGKRFKGQWKYRVGDHRVIARINDGIMIVTVIDIGHRSAVYR